MNKSEGAFERLAKTFEELAQLSDCKDSHPAGAIVCDFEAGSKKL